MPAAKYAPHIDEVESWEAQPVVQPPKRRRGPVVVHSQDMQPPARWDAFYIKLSSKTDKDAMGSVGALADDTLEWVARTVAAEMLRRKGQKYPLEYAS